MTHKNLMAAVSMAEHQASLIAILKVPAEDQFEYWDRLMDIAKRHRETWRERESLQKAPILQTEKKRLQKGKT